MHFVIEERLIKQGVTDFYDGGAIGFDMLAAETVIELKAEYPDIKLHMLLPCPANEQIKGWNKTQITRYQKILQAADSISIVSEHYTKDCMKRRNERLVELSDCCIYHVGKLSVFYQFAHKHIVLFMLHKHFNGIIGESKFLEFDVLCDAALGKAEQVVCRDIKEPCESDNAAVPCVAGRIILQTVVHRLRDLCHLTKLFCGKPTLNAQVFELLAHCGLNLHGFRLLFDFPYPSIIPHQLFKLYTTAPFSGQFLKFFHFWLTLVFEF